MKPSFSFLILTYKQEQFVEEAILSVLHQDVDDVEVVISDDCSPDATFEIVEKVVSAYKGAKKVILNRNERNLGLGAHVDVAAKLCHGDWIITGAGDDVQREDRVRVLRELQEQHDDCLCFGSNYQVIDEEGAELEDLTGADAYYPFKSLKNLSGVPFIFGCVAMWHRSLFADFPSMQGVNAEDTVLSVRAFLKRGGAFCSGQSLVQYRVHSHNICNFKEDDVRAAKIKRSRLQFRSCIQGGIDVMHLATTDKSYSVAEIDHLLRLTTQNTRTILLYPYIQESFVLKLRWMSSTWRVRPNLFVDAFLKRAKRLFKIK